MRLRSLISKLGLMTWQCSTFSFAQRVGALMELGDVIPCYIQATLLEEKVLVYNVSTQHYVGATCPRLLFPASLEDLKSTFLSHQSKTKFMVTPPLIESDREKLLVMKT
ncbi:hypothetical protein Bca4012_092466 [Brassica carinata]|uniref:Uncharacterized protein n=1 Tax=Brassica carinata TaxID=52824 RepID=A0A8X7TV46_BRACI|nr:hypothetical protein Bca52824_074851 [Brassica carinata]